MKKLLAVASAGGHWTQLTLIQDAFVGFEVTYLTTTINSAAERRLPNSPLMLVRQARFTQKVAMVVLSFQVLLFVIRLRPDVVVSTGAAPGFFAVLFGKLMGAKTIWVDSVANYSELSLSGRKIRPFCDKFLVQWPHLSQQGVFWGSVL